MTNETQIRMWHEWRDERGAYQTEETSFEAWQSEMRPYKAALLAVWACKLQLLLEQNPDEVPLEALLAIHQDAETLRTLDDTESWEEPFNRMRGAFTARDFVGLRVLAWELVL